MRSENRGLSADVERLQSQKIAGCLLMLKVMKSGNRGLSASVERLQSQ